MPKIVKNWKDLDGLESEHYYIKVDHHIGCGWIKPKDETRRSHNKYLSTHTFYSKAYKGYEELLQACGFDVNLVSWDEEE